jgi:hypothetical protein
MRFALVRLRPGEHWLLRVNHHIITDTWSWKVYLRELRLLYEAKLRGAAPPLRESEPLHYGDYAAWQRRTLRPEGRACRDDIRWWKERLAGAPAAFDVPCKRTTPLPDADAHEGILWWGIDARIARQLERVRLEEGATNYVVRLAALVALLADESGQPDVVLGTYVTNRKSVPLQGMFGFFSNLTTLRLRSDPSVSFRTWLKTTRKTVNEIQARGEIPYELLCDELRRQEAYPPKIRVIFTIPDQTGAHTLGGVELTWLERRLETMPWGFSLSLDQHDEERRCRVAFDARTYDPAAVHRLLDRYVRLLDAASTHPGRTLRELLAATARRERPTLQVHRAA